MSKVLLDSSVIIDFLRQKDKSNTHLVKLVERKYRLCVSIITYVESFAGKSVWEKKQIKDDLDSLFSGMEILDLDVAIARDAGELRARFGLSTMDAVIASTALSYQLSLVTLNMKDFQVVPQLEFFTG